MSLRSIKWFILIAVFCCLVLSTSCYALKTSRLYTLTIYVDEGHDELNGHVYLSLSDSSKSYVRGFYAKNKLLAPISAGGGEVRNDYRLTLYKWDVKKTYVISSSDFQIGLDAIDAWSNNNESWWIDHHCGDFVETVAKAAGIDLDLPINLTGYNRPGLFGKYLRQNGGQVRQKGEFQLPEVNPPVLPPDAAASDLNGRWQASGYINADEVVIIRHYGNVVSAVKTKGNKFVSANVVTWQGVYTSDSFSGMGQVAENDANGDITKRYFVEVTISVRNNDYITVSGPKWGTGFVSYTRIRN